MTGSAEGRPLVLVVDDDDMSRLVLAEAVQAGGSAVAEARNGREGVEAFARLHPDMVILDVLMPVMNGLDACRAIRRKPGGDITPVLILTGMDDLDSIRNAYEAGATDFASKPISPLVLGHRVLYMLRARRALADLSTSEARLAKAQRIARLGHWELDLRTETLSWSDEVFNLYGVTPGEFRPSREACLLHVHPEDRERVSEALRVVMGEGRAYDLDFRILLPEGQVRTLHELAEIHSDESGNPVVLAGITQDITERRLVEERIRFLAYYDSLTSLPNRAYFQERLEGAIASARRQQRTLAIMFLDLDRFKRINDTLGHPLGDQLLQGVGERLRRSVRSGDWVARPDTGDAPMTIARFGGDEFVISLTGIGRGEHAAKVARRLLGSLRDPFQLGGHEVTVTGSIGISLFPNDGDSVETLLKKADAAMYQAKNSGRNNYFFYDERMNASAFQRMTLENGLRRALERRELTLHYQPLVNAAEERIVGAEALLRWNHPEMGLVSPADFIPVAEESGLILPIGEWVLETALRQGLAWHRQGHRDLRLAVNLSGQQVGRGTLIGFLQRALADTPMPAGLIDLEITESVLMDSSAANTATLQALRELGLRIAIDDFGTGYSSLAYLARFPIDTLKIDRSFVRNMVDDRRSAAIVAAIAAMARGLSVTLIAEGVQDARQRDLLLAQGCIMMQGYHFSPPLSAEDFSRLLAEPSLRLGTAA